MKLDKLLQKKKTREEGEKGDRDTPGASVVSTFYCDSGEKTVMGQTSVTLVGFSCDAEMCDAEDETDDAEGTEEKVVV